MVGGKQTPKQASWPDTHHFALEKHGVSWSSVVPPPSITGSSWYPILCDRERQVLGEKLQRTPNARAVDVSQTFGREPPASGVRDDGDGAAELLPCLTPSLRVVLREDLAKGEPRLMVGREALRLQGAVGRRGLRAYCASLWAKRGLMRSKLSPLNKDHRNCVAEQSGASGATLADLREFLVRHELALLIIENVHDILEKHQTTNREVPPRQRIIDYS